MIVEYRLGEFKDDQQNGNGTYYFVNGKKYTGGWVNNQKTGQGVLILANGDRYEVEYSQMLFDDCWR